MALNAQNAIYLTVKTEQFKHTWIQTHNYNKTINLVQTTQK